MPTTPRRTGKPSGRSGGAPDMMARATAQASRDASALFAHLEDHQNDWVEDAPPDVARADAERAALALEHLASLVRAGVWTAELAELGARAQQVEATIDDASARE